MSALLQSRTGRFIGTSQFPDKSQKIPCSEGILHRALFGAQALPPVSSLVSSRKPTRRNAPQKLCHSFTVPGTAAAPPLSTSAPTPETVSQIHSPTVSRCQDHAPTPLWKLCRSSTVSQSHSPPGPRAPQLLVTVN